MTLVVDCSVALKWVLVEEGREAALDLIGQALIAPDFLTLECANVLALKARGGLISPARARASLKEIEALPGLVFRQSSVHVGAAQELSLELAQTAYDCLYLALAISEDATLVTADEKFERAVSANAAYAALIRRL
ncbi:MAG: type II toxin-antitoxin system VapC family toxin [Brevundimonas sp.]